MAASTPKYTALVMAAGSGTRMHSSVKKQFADLCGMPVVAHSLLAFEKNARISAIVLVVPKGDTDEALKICMKYGIHKVRNIVEGSDQRFKSVYNGLKCVPEEVAEEIVRTVKSQISVPLSVKFRLGYTFDELNFVEYGQRMQSAGADFITIHGRTRSQMYGGKADWKKIAELKRNVDIPVFANGDVVSIETAEQCLEESQADGVAIGRGVLGDPSLIARVERYFSTGEYLPPPSLEEKIAGMKKHLMREVEFRGEDIGIKFVRKFYPYYVNGFPGASRCRGELVLMNNLNEINKMLDTIALQSSKNMLV